MGKVKVAFLVDDLQTDFYVNELIQFVYENQEFSTPTLLTGYKFKKKQSSFLKRLYSIYSYGFTYLLNKILFKFLITLINLHEKRIVSKKYPNYGMITCISNMPDLNVVHLKGKWSKNNLYLSFRDYDLEIIKDLDLDCIIRCGSGILKGEILNISRFGVLSFHHGDNRVNRGGPSGFWEVLNGSSDSGFVIQKLNSELDGGEILVRGNLMTSKLWFLNHANLLEKSNDSMKLLLKNIVKYNSLPISEGVRLHGNRLLKLNSSIVLFRYIASRIIPELIKTINGKVLSVEVDRWSVAYAEHDGFSKSLWRYNEVQNPKGRFLADPFVFEHEHRQYIFVEDYFYSDDKGRISVIEANGQEYNFLGIVLDEPFHLSFPFVFEHDGQIYMLPETHAVEEIRLYKCINFPMNWQLETVLMKQVSAADSMLIRVEQKWFLLTNICSSGGIEHQSELHIFFADDFKTQDWKPITSGNPVIFDSSCARNGGIFEHNGQLYRVNQMHGTARYGKAFAVNEIKLINQDVFVESNVAIVEAKFKDDIIATHHFSANDKIAAVDFCRKQRLNSVLATPTQ